MGGAAAQLNVTAHTLPTHGSHGQPALVSVSKIPDPVVTPHPAHPRATALAQHKVVKITTPKESSPKTQLQERPLPQLLPPLPGKISSRP